MNDELIDEPIDRTIDCVECGTPFQWSVRDQVFYASRGYGPPKRCRRCRPLQRARGGKGWRTYDKPEGAAH